MPVFLRLIRVKNLIFLAFMEFMMQKSVNVPILQTFGFDAFMSDAYLTLLIAGSVFIAAGGYILNDYFDVKIDLINRPEKVIVTRQISKSTAMILHQFLSITGVLCGLLLAWFARSFTVALVFILIPGMLWFYSASYKRQFLIGNLVVAFNAAVSVFIVGIAQLAFLEKTYGKLIFETPLPGQLYMWIGGFGLFAFLTTWIREIIKDMEDEAGDREMECRTMPIKWGKMATTWFATVLIILTSALLLYFSVSVPFDGTLTLRYVLPGIILPLAMLLYLLFSAKVPADYHQASSLTKLIMLIGVLYSLIFYYLQAKTYGFSIFNHFMVK